MRKILVIFGKLWVCVLALIVLCDTSFAGERLKWVAEGVYAYMGAQNDSKENSFGANTGVIIGTDGIAVVDTLISAKAAKGFIQDIRAISKKPIKYVINTHYHLDHVFGNCEFAKLGAIIIAQENDKAAMEKSAQATLDHIADYGLTAEDIKGTTPAYPVLTYKERMTIDLGGQQIELIHARHSHTDGDTIVYIPEKKLLFTGDILFTDYHPFLAEGDIEEWTKELDQIKAMDVLKIIPGHGPLSGKKDLMDMKAYLTLFDQKAKELAAQSDDVKKIATEIQDILPKRPKGAWLIGANIQMKYLNKK